MLLDRVRAIASQALGDRGLAKPLAPRPELGEQYRDLDRPIGLAMVCPRRELCGVQHGWYRWRPRVSIWTGATTDLSERTLVRVPEGLHLGEARKDRLGAVEQAVDIGLLGREQRLGMLAELVAVREERVALGEVVQGAKLVL
jgi:hypothetical protein